MVHQFLTKGNNIYDRDVNSLQFLIQKLPLTRPRQTYFIRVFLQAL